MVALEGKHKLVLVHRHDAGQRHGEVVTKPDLPVPLVREVVHQLLVLARLPRQDLEILDGRRIQRLESMALKHLPHNCHHPLPEDHLAGEVIPKAFEDLWLAGFHRSRQRLHLFNHHSPSPNGGVLRCLPVSASRGLSSLHSSLALASRS